MRIVMKFGGSSLSDADRIERVVDIAKDNRAEDDVVLVVSALGSVTDLLLDMATDAATGADEERLEEELDELLERHVDVASRVMDDPKREEDLHETVEDLVEELRNLVFAVNHLGELTERSRDYVMSFGEKLSAAIVSAALDARGENSEPLWEDNLGIVTDSAFGSARPDMETSRENLRENVLPRLERGEIPVATGYVAQNDRGIVTTLGRGGSDYSASIIGASIDADEIWIYTDVDGVMTCDPRIEPRAQTIPVLSYREAMEVSFFGAEVLHPKTIKPAMERGIPVRVRNTFNPDAEGTKIIREHEKVEDVVKAVTTVEDVALINISGVGMIGAPGVAARAFSAMGDAGVNIMMISTGSSEATISMVVEEGDVSKARGALSREFRNGVVEDVSAMKDVTVVTVVGAGMAGTPGIAGRVFSTLGNGGVNVIMISQGSSEYNISFVVSEESEPDAVTLLHDEFELQNLQAKARAR